MKGTLAPVYSFFEERGWTPLDFQEEAWAAFLEGQSGLIQVPTGSGKTFAATLAPVAEIVAEPSRGLKLLYLTPLRAVSRDIEKALAEALAEIAPGLRVESRTGDTGQSARKRQMKEMPDILLTTPESLSVLLSYKGADKLFSRLRAVVVDEWHELLSTKRGTQTELCLARLRTLAPELRTWAMSASLANLEEAARAVTGVGAQEPRIVRSSLHRDIHIKSVLPERIRTFPWAGHLGSAMLKPLLEALDIERSTLLFTNTRRQAERWYKLLLDAAPEHAPLIALHHGSIDRKERERVEAGVKLGRVKWVVATSSLDLGVDFQPVERVVQIGSPKAVARVMQRAGRSAHAPGGVSELLFVPTNALELVEIAAARRALEDGVVEARRPLSKPFDVLAQHLVTLACGDGFKAADVLQEVRTTAAYASITDDEFADVLNLIEHGGRSLRAYPEYHKVEVKDGLYRAASQKVARRHRMSIGTITTGGSVFLKFTNRQKLGSIDERFVSRLKPGDTFLFAGRTLEFVMMKDMSAFVRVSKKPARATPSFAGGALPLSDALSAYVRRELGASEGSPELDAVQPILQRQRDLSKVPEAGELLLEHAHTREGSHLFLYPFAGRSVHEGLAAVLALRMARRRGTTFSYAVNDYGLEFLAPKGYAFEDVLTPELFSRDGLEADVRESVNLAELAKRQFREVAQVAGLLFAGYPGSRKGAWGLQASGSVLFEVLREYDPESVLLKQAEREVLDEDFGLDALAEVLAALQTQPWTWCEVGRPTPLGFPLFVERLRARLSTETLSQRVMRMVEAWAHV